MAKRSRGQQRAAAWHTWRAACLRRATRSARSPRPCGAPLGCGSRVCGVERQRARASEIHAEGFSEVAVQTGPQTVQNALRGAKFARAGRPLAGFVASFRPNQRRAAEKRPGKPHCALEATVNANKNLSNSAPMEPGMICRVSPYKTLDFDLVGT